MPENVKMFVVQVDACVDPIANQKGIGDYRKLVSHEMVLDMIKGMPHRITE